MMKRFIVTAGMIGAMMAATATGATAHVHGVSQAGCAASGAPSGAQGSIHAIEKGRPGPPIPVTASDGKTQGQGGSAAAQGTNCS